MSLFSTLAVKKEHHTAENGKHVNHPISEVGVVCFLFHLFFVWKETSNEPSASVFIRQPVWRVSVINIVIHLEGFSSLINFVLTVSEHFVVAESYTDHRIGPVNFTVLCWGKAKKKTKDALTPWCHYHGTKLASPLYPARREESVDLHTDFYHIQIHSFNL